MTIILCIYPKIWSLMDRIFCYFWPFFALLPPPPLQQLKKSKFWKTVKKPWRYYHFTHVKHKSESYNVWFLRYWACQTEFFVILDHFLPFPLTTQKIKILKNWNKHWRYYHFTQVYQKSRSYAILFLRYGRWQM